MYCSQHVLVPVISVSGEPQSGMSSLQAKLALLDSANDSANTLRVDSVDSLRFS